MALPLSKARAHGSGATDLLEQIGEGGFGVVFMAEQTDPVRRKVALKIIKPGMDTKEVIARFEAERQALAMMDHPHVAKVLDGGATESGRPYFVMELVRGVSITEYCDKRRLNTQSRLELFVDVCHAVQHAHQKGVIHRDIKPTNIMVTLYDDKPVVKVIDFGVSKAIQQQLTEKTLFTRYGQMVGTPQYMSPEQAGMSGLDIDTRGDIYSLGVLLYELLTGGTPLTVECLRTAAYADMQRLIREAESDRPSTRLSTTARQKLLDIASNRATSPNELRDQLRGDLDWIVMKSLEKDRTRRYATAIEFAADIQRHLAGGVVEACPPSPGYRLRKLAPAQGRPGDRRGDCADSAGRDDREYVVRGYGVSGGAAGAGTANRRGNRGESEGVGTPGGTRSSARGQRASRKHETPAVRAARRACHGGAQGKQPARHACSARPLSRRPAAIGSGRDWTGFRNQGSW